ncbi:MAG: Nif3-like dinuclear metal center hexameric protein [Deltaproteobacteria bacterium]|nr:Nif3-like dinuclear metal center hexameric protein [Deltaproteobacteria bacterium]
MTTVHTVGSLSRAMEAIAPTRFAASWDNVGLLAGDPTSTITSVLLCIDLTREVFDEACSLGVQAIIAYHPPLFKPLARVTQGSLIYEAIRHDIAIYSPHTALDAADGGTNDVLADCVGISRHNRTSLAPPPSRETHCKLVTFVPRDAQDRVCDALFAAGAGVIGHYTQCSFRVDGHGTFLGDPAHTSPAVGQAGQRERAEETRVEVLVPLALREAIVQALYAAHPYETPAFDLVKLLDEPEHKGYGRVGSLTAPTHFREVLSGLKQALGVSHVLVAGPTDRVITRAAVGAGSTGEYLGAALAQRVDLFVLGELRHHDALRAASAGLTVVMTLHSVSERATLRHVQSRLRAALPELSLHLSQRDHDPLVIC